MAFTLWTFFEATLLCLNAICVLNEERFLAKVGWASWQNVQGFGEPPTAKSQILNLIKSIRTVMRERRTVATGRPARCSIAAAGRSVAGAGSAGVASGALADLIELGHLDGLPDAFKIDAYNAGLIAGHAVLRRRDAILRRWCSIAGARSVSASTESARLLGLRFLLQEDLTDLLEQRSVHGSAFASLVASGYLGVATAAEGTTAAKGATTATKETTATATATGSAVTVTGGHRRLRQGEPCQTDNHTLSLGRKLAAISNCLGSRDNNHLTHDSANGASARGKEDPLIPAQFFYIFHVDDNTLKKSCDMPTGRSNLLFCKDETERRTAQSSGRTVGSRSQKESLRHQEEKYAAIFLGTDDMNDRSTDGFSRHRYRRLRGLSPIRASCPRFRFP
ncbi:Immediate early response 3-interacting protein 1 [Trachymyrmex zeteki]|uniref:Immediate early response 3-interacting protein 1 n=1 Tax=Mycetomoellerius zeteki TaxID=64791 RepID=A0A151WWD6_9HYME|nr:Immediate early response 3-interacting protein 1 [Trachymyrmex zeteki]